MFVAEQCNSASSVCVSPKRAERCCLRRSRLNERITVRVSLGGPDLRDLVRARCSATLRRRKQRAADGGRNCACCCDGGLGVVVLNLYRLR